MGSKLYKLCDQGALVLLCALMADCCIFGAGRLVMFGPLSFRMLLVAALLALSIPLVITQFFRLLKSPFTWALVAFAVMLLIETFWGLHNENSNTIMLSDLKGFSYFIVFLPAMCVLTNKKRIHLLMKVMLYAGGALSIISLVILCLCLYAPEAYYSVYLLGLRQGFSAFAPVTPVVPRLFFNSSMYLVCCCAFGLYFQIQEQDKRLRIRYSLITGSALFSLLLTYTRSIYLAVFIAAAVLLVLLISCRQRFQSRKLGKHIAVSVLTLILLMGLFNCLANTNYFRYALERVGVTFLSSGEPSAAEPPIQQGQETLPSGEDLEDWSSEAYMQATEQSDSLRVATKQELLQKIRKSPVIGNGLGVALECRNGGNNEYIYLDMLAKTGVIGLLLYFMPFFLMIVCLVKNRGERLLLAPWFAALLGLIVFSYFNPYMNAALGVLFYCCTIAVFQFSKETKVQKSE